MKNVGANWADIQNKVKAGAPDTVGRTPKPISLTRSASRAFSGGLAHRQVEGEARHLAEMARVPGRGGKI